MCMKKLKKLIVLLLALALVFDARVPVFAADTKSSNELIHYDEFYSGMEKRCEVAYSGATLMVKGQSVSLGSKGFVSDNPAVVAVNGSKAVAKKPGSATLTSSKDASVTKTFTVVQPVMSFKKKTLMLGETFSLELTDKATKDAIDGIAYVSWLSSKPAVASVDEEGNVTALASGSTTVAAWVNGKKYSCSVTVKAPKGSKQLANALFVNMGKKVKASAIKGTTAKSLISSLNTDIATVNKNVITGVYAGTATISQNGYTYNVYVDYPAPVDDGEKIIKSEVKNKESYLLKLNKGEIYNLSLPLVNQNVSWKSSNKKTVTVNEKGDVYALKAGKATLTAKVNKTSVKVNVEVSATTIDEVAAQDTDGDGLADVDEKSFGTDPEKVDTDDDGLTDFEEIYVTQTSAVLADTNSNGISDSEDDEDGDNLANRYEIDNNTNPLATDTDNDGLDDYVEINSYGTDSTNADTDSDTISDGKEVELGLDPLKAMTDGVTPDAERKFDQSVSNDTASELYEAASKAIPTVTGSLAGYAEDHVSISVVEKTELKDARFVIGEAYSITTDYESTEGLTLQFTCRENAGSILDLTIGMFDEEGNMKVLDAAVDGSTLSTDLIGNGDYFVMNLRSYLNSLGITVDTTPEPETPEEDEGEGLIDDTFSDVPATGSGSNEVSEEWFRENYVLVDSEGRVVEEETFDDSEEEDVWDDEATDEDAFDEEVIDEEMIDEEGIDEEASDEVVLDDEAAADDEESYEGYDFEEDRDYDEQETGESEELVLENIDSLRTGDVLENGYHYVLKGTLDSNYTKSRIHYSSIGDANNDDEAELLGTEGIPAQADIVFIVDTTGSMSSGIRNVAENINAFVTELSTNYNVLCNFAFVDFRDITCGEETRIVKSKSGSNWFTDVDEFRNMVSSVSVSGGGDDPETPFDGFGMADTLDFRTGASRFYILITDASYKTNNNYGIKDIDDLTQGLLESGTIASVISYSGYANTYRKIYEETDGVFGNISSGFSSTLMALAGKIGAKLADGNWVVLRDSRLSRNYQIRCLKAPVTEGSDTDTDEDGIPDCKELTEKDKFDFITEIQILLRRYGLSDEVNVMDGLDVYLYDSDPTLKDTDFDGVDDKLDKKPRNNHFEAKLTYKEGASCNVEFNVDYSILLDESNTDYHKDLSVYSSLMAADIYHQDCYLDLNTPSGMSVRTNDAFNLSDFFGMEDGKFFEVNPSSDPDDRTEFYVGHKEVSNNNKKREIILLVVRGTGKDKYGNGGDIEWSSNFDVGSSANYNYTAMTGSHPDWKNKDNHKGFDVAANNALSLFKGYIEEHGLSDKKKTVLITGHSRGAGIANILGAYLEDDNNYRTFTYTFASPYTTTSSKATNYSTIFNIANTDDLVTYLPLRYWGFKKYGKMLEISVADKLEDSKPFSDRVGSFEWLIGADYNNDRGTDRTVGAFENVVSTRSGIYNYDYTDGLYLYDIYFSKISADNAAAKLKKDQEKYRLSRFAKFEVTKLDGKLIDTYAVTKVISPAYFMQDLANAAGGAYGDGLLNSLKAAGVYIGLAGGKYETAKGSFIASSGKVVIGGMEHPHMQPTYYLIAQYGIK